MDTYELTYSYLSRPPFLSPPSLFLSLSRSYAPLPCRVQGNIGTSLYQSMSHSPRFPSSWFLLHRSYTRVRRNDIICYFVPRDFPRIFDIKVPSDTYEFRFLYQRTFFRTLDGEFSLTMDRRICSLRCVILRICGN